MRRRSVWKGYLALETQRWTLQDRADAMRLMRVLDARNGPRTPKGPGEIECGEPSVVSVPSGARLPAGAGDSSSHKDRAGAPCTFRMSLGLPQTLGGERTPQVPRNPLPAHQVRRLVAANDDRAHATSIAASAIVWQE